MTTHQWIFTAIVIAVPLGFGLILLSGLGQLFGTTLIEILFGLLIMLIIRVGPFVLLAYGIWAFFIEGRVNT